MKVSVVILNWNGCDMLRTFLPSVVRYSEGEGIEVCVADMRKNYRLCSFFCPPVSLTALYYLETTVSIPVVSIVILCISFVSFLTSLQFIW